MTNIYDEDANSLMAMRFESGALTTDATGNHDSGDWLQNGTPAAVADTPSSIGDGGSYSVDMVPNESYSLPDSDLVSGFPCKNSGGSTTFSICVWVKADGFSGTDKDICSKYNHTASDRNFRLSCFEDTGIFSFYRGYNSGASWESIFEYGTGLSTGTWYHIAFCYNDTTGAGYVSIVNEAGTELDTIINTTDTGHNISSTSENFRIGSRQSASYWDGHIDECWVFNKFLTPTEIAAIRAGTFGASGGGLEMEIAMHHYTKNIGT